MRDLALHIRVLAVAIAAVSIPALAVASPASGVDDIVDDALSQELADDAQWHALMHYRPALFGGVESDIDAPDFFLSDDGATDPNAELEATIRAVVNDGDVACRFPARVGWLDDHLELVGDASDDVSCNGFDHWRDDIDADSATLIFASSYLNNPASMFGHTLMRLDRDTDGHAARLESTVVNVTADPWTYNPVLYIAMGLTGGFDGLFVTLPFDAKVQKYTDRERREMWEYELDLADDELQRMVRHLWELRHVHADYRYFDENCSYFLMSLLEVADPTLELRDQFSLHVLPGDMVRAVLDVDDLAGERHVRPSSRQAMRATRQRLESDEAVVARRLGLEEEPGALDELDGFDDRRRALILDAAYALWRYHNPPDEASGPVDSDWARQLGAQRDGLDVDTPVLTPPVETAPEDGHRTSRLTLSGGLSKSGHGHFDLGLRPALHDLAASDVGYRPLSQLELFNVQLRVGGIDRQGASPGVWLQQLDILDVVSLTPIDRWSRNWSWSLKTGFDRVYRPDCPDGGCLVYDAGFGAGAAVEFGPLATYLLMEGQLAFGPTFDRNIRFGAGPRAGGRLSLGHRARLLVEGRYLYPVWGEGFPDFAVATDHTGPPWSTEATLSVSATQNLELRARGLAQRNRAEAGLQLHLYF